MADDLSTTFFSRQLSSERRPQPDCDPPCCVLQRGGSHWAAGDGRQRSEASHCRQNPGHPQELRQQGRGRLFNNILFIIYALQEYFTSSGTYPEGLNGSGYYGNLPVQQAHSTTPHEAPHSVSVTAGGPPGGPPAGALLDDANYVYPSGTVQCSPFMPFI